MNAGYHPRPGSLAARLIAYLEITPRAQLTRAEVADLFDVMPNSLEANLDNAIKNGALAKHRNADGEQVWCLPSTAKAIQQQEQEASAMTKRNHSTAVRNLTAPKRGSISIPASELDFSGLKVETGVPVLGKEKGRFGVSKWQPLLDKLTEPGQSIEIPVTWKSALAAHINKVNTDGKKAGRPERYLARITGPETARVWRLA